MDFFLNRHKKIEPPKPQLPTITFGGIGTYAPTQDITPYEASLLALMLAHASSQYPCELVDWKGYVEKNNLGRHFKPWGSDE